METQRRRGPSTGFLLTLGIPLLAFLWFLWVLKGGGRWELSATNTPAGIEVTVFQGKDGEPMFRTLLANRQAVQDLERITIDTLPANVGRTVFTDETMRPGRWTLEMDSVELDIMPGRMIIDKTTEVDPLK